MNGSGTVDLPDLATFAAAFPPGAYDYCADFNCDGIINLIDLSIFGVHWLHTGPVPGFCQPGVDHYKVYRTYGPPMPGPIFLEDQFGFIDVPDMMLSRFATPASKNGQMVYDPVAHQSWWELQVPQPMRMVIARDQFGEHEWMLLDARYLINPALKNDITPELPMANHYLCYDAQGPDAGVEVVLADQFGEETVLVLHGIYFCNPVQKTAPDGMVYPIVDPYAHLTCYLVDNPFINQISVLMRDQFVEMPIDLFENDCLCLPALKRQVIEPNTSEWDRIRSLFE